MPRREHEGRTVWDPDDEEMKLLTGESRAPNFPILPVKQQPSELGQWPELGVIIQHAGLKEVLGEVAGSTRVYKISMMSIRSLDDLLKAEFVDFNTITDFTNAGWMVD